VLRTINSSIVRTLIGLNTLVSGAITPVSVASTIRMIVASTSDRPACDFRFDMKGVVMIGSAR